MPIPVHELFTGCLLPFALTLMVWWSTHAAWLVCFGASETTEDAAGVAGGEGGCPIAAPVALMLGFVAGYGLLGIAPWQPKSHWHHLPYVLAVGALVGGAVEALLGRLPAVRVGVLGLVAIGTPGILLPSWELNVPRYIYLGLFGALLLVLTVALRRQGNDRVNPVSSNLHGQIVLGVTCLTAVIVVLLSGSLRFMQLALLVSSCIAALLVIPQKHLPWRGGELWIALSLVSLLVIAEVNSFSNIPSWTYLLVALAPLIGFVSLPSAVAQSSNLGAPQDREQQDEETSKRVTSRSYLRLVPPLLLLLAAVVSAVIAEFVLKQS